MGKLLKPQLLRLNEGEMDKRKTVVQLASVLIGIRREKMGKKHRKNLTNDLGGVKHNSNVVVQTSGALNKSSGNTISNNPTNHPYSVSELNINKEYLEKILLDRYRMKVESINKKVCELGNKLNDLLQQNFFKFKNGNALYPKTGYLFYKEAKVCESLYCGSSIGDFYQELNKILGNWESEVSKEEKLTFVSLKGNDVRDCLSRGMENPFCEADKDFGFITHRAGSRWCYMSFDRKTYGCDFSCWRTYNVVGILVCKIYDKKHKMTLKDLTTFMLNNQYIPAGFRDADVKNLIELRPYLLFENKDDISTLKLNVNEFLTVCEKGGFCGDVFGEKFNDDFNLLANGKAKISDNDIEPLRDFILKCDNIRANRAPYSVDYFVDPNKGVWELAEEPEKDTVKVQLEQSVQANARPPQMDVNKSLVCAIDFGTKSTVVARIDENDVVKLLRIGTSDFTKKAEQADYENPTVIEIRDKQNFENRYKARKGRPYTEWEQLTVSHNAVNVLNNNEDKSEVYNTIFKELKQWANDKKRRLQLIDRTGLKFDVPPYLETKDGDFDPIEVYAYYLGLYINNMESGICLHYVLSFPVNYEKEVQDKLLKSFERGLKKSLPPTILKDIEGKKIDFKIYAGASEPAAYAACALSKHDLEPQNEGDKVFYGVFDFGGGTTDFDFGVEEYGDEEYDYVIRQFGKGGDVHLGGENILAMMAFEVYRRNLDESQCSGGDGDGNPSQSKSLREEKVPMVLPYDYKRKQGEEGLVFDIDKASREAFLNRQRIAEKLRNHWEKNDGKGQPNENEPINVQLYDTEGTSKQYSLKVDYNSIDKLVEERIKKAIKNFFAAMPQKFREFIRNSGGRVTVPINVLLAGNSCKHPKVKELFEKEKEEFIKKYLGDANKMTDKDNEFIKIWGVLGEKKAKTDEENYDEQATGKTGVVFGLIKSRDGGLIKFINENLSDSGQVKFPFYVGRFRRNVFEKKLTPESGDGWILVCPVDKGKGTVELYYTIDAQCDNLPSNEFRRESCNFEEAKKKRNFYVRKKGAHELEFALTEISKDGKGNVPSAACGSITLER